MPIIRFEIVAFEPDPDINVPSGLCVITHVPDEGNPLRITPPVGTVHVGCVMVPTIGAGGVTGCVVITMLADVSDVHPSAVVTVKL